MATYVKFQDFADQLVRGVHDFEAHVFKLALTNASPTAATDVGISTITQISATNGYSAGGNTVTVTVNEAGGTMTVTGTKSTFTASGGSVGPFRYYVLYNDTATSPADAVIAYWDHGSNVTLNDGESFTVKFNNGDPTGTIFTLA